MIALITSLKFHPGHFSHLVANYRMFEELGYKPILYVHPSFGTMDPENKYVKINSLTGISRTDVKVAVFWFPSLKNIVEIFRLRTFCKARVLYVYHEPFDSLKSYYKAGFSFSKIIRICLIGIANIPVLLMSHNVILPSDVALSIYEQKYRWLNGHYSMIPLLFDDEAKGREQLHERKYISYIGTIAADHAFDRFVEFVYTSVKNRWFHGYVFLIATRSQLPESSRRLLKDYIASGEVVVNDGDIMTNQTINDYYSKSAVVWNAYNRSMQSGVLPKAYMFGVPVIVLAKNGGSLVDNEKTGILVDDNRDVFELRAAVEKLLTNRKFWHDNCREKFLNTFFYGVYSREFKGLISIKLE